MIHWPEVLGKSNYLKVSKYSIRQQRGQTEHADFLALDSCVIIFTVCHGNEAPARIKSNHGPKHPNRNLSAQEHQSSTLPDTISGCYRAGVGAGVGGGNDWGGPAAGRVPPEPRVHASGKNTRHSKGNTIIKPEQETCGTEQRMGGGAQNAYLEDFSKGSISQLTDDLPDLLRVFIPADVLVLFLLLLRSQFEYFTKIKKRHRGLFCWKVPEGIQL